MQRFCTIATSPIKTRYPIYQIASEWQVILAVPSYSRMKLAVKRCGTTSLLALCARTPCVPKDELILDSTTFCCSPAIMVMFLALKNLLCKLGISTGSGCYHVLYPNPGLGWLVRHRLPTQSQMFCDSIGIPLVVVFISISHREVATAFALQT